MTKRRFGPDALFWWMLLLITWALSTWSFDLYKALDARWIIKYPAAWRLPMEANVTAAIHWLMEEASFGFFTFRDLTRGVAALIEAPYEVMRDLLIDGFSRGLGENAVQIAPPLSWIAVIVTLVATGHYARDWRLAALVGACFAYLAVFGQWESAMVTLASVLIAVPVGAVGGLILGILAFRHRWVERALRPVLDLMQTVPVFAYLVPVLILFGFGPVAALVATVIYAMPPMVRVTSVALQGVPPEVVEVGRMSGCTRRQLMWKILVPSSLPTLMVGVNQVIMLTLNMVIIASMIGAGGLGYDVLASLRRLDIGAGIEAG
ncbi:MAG: ABC transporter permease subunit, partial [Pseudomonadota bacterium]